MARWHANTVVTQADGHCDVRHSITKVGFAGSHFEARQTPMDAIVTVIG